MKESDFRKPDKIRILLFYWMEIEAPGYCQRAYQKIIGNKIIVIVGEELHENNWWLHVSCSGQRRIPNWEELNEVKDIFIGRDKKAIQVFPAENEKINFNPYVLHLYCCLQEDKLPDFRKVFDGFGI